MTWSIKNPFAESFNFIITLGTLHEKTKMQLFQICICRILGCKVATICLDFHEKNFFKISSLTLLGKVNDLKMQKKEKVEFLKDEVSQWIDSKKVWIAFKVEIYDKKVLAEVKLAS